MKMPSHRGIKSSKSPVFASRWRGLKDENAKASEVSKVAEVQESIPEVHSATFDTSTTLAFPENIPEQEPPVPINSPWIAHEWPHVDTPLCFSRDEQPKGRGALMLVYAPWGSVLSGGPVIVLDVRDDGLGREYLWHDPIEDRQRWHAAELCQGVKQAVPEPHDVDRFEAVLLDRWEEKAAILEYDEGYPRAEAERLAWEALGVVAPGTAEEAA